MFLIIKVTKNQLLPNKTEQIIDLIIINLIKNLIIKIIMKIKIKKLPI